MAKIHVLTADNYSHYRVVIHTPVLPGNNSAGKTWKSVLLSSGISGATVLTEGTGPGQISTAEKATVVAGDVIEIVGTILAESGGTTPASIDQMVDVIINNTKDRYAREKNNRIEASYAYRTKEPQTVSSSACCCGHITV